MLTVLCLLQQVRNESAEDFFELLKEWQKLTKRFENDVETRSNLRLSKINDFEKESHDNKVPSGEYEVLKLVDICYGDPNKTGNRGLKFKVLQFTSISKFSLLIQIAVFIQCLYCLKILKKVSSLSTMEANLHYVGLIVNFILLVCTVAQ